GRDPVRAMKEGVLGPGGHVVDAPEEPHERCPFCDGDDGGEPDDADEVPEDDAGLPEHAEVQEMCL
ncbi:MAG TPA: hypothetical protein VN253_00135, partial [Kofleriaceae bacterium]|nr:hypothetical protein [Kofleriaceae bacterium]